MTGILQKMSSRQTPRTRPAMRNQRPVHLLAGGRSGTRGDLYKLIQRVYTDNRVIHPTIAYIGAASGDDESFFLRNSENLRAAGARNVIPTQLSSDKVDPEKAKEILNSADLVYVSGGDVFEGIQSLKRRT